MSVTPVITWRCFPCAHMEYYSSVHIRAQSLCSHDSVVPVFIRQGSPGVYMSAIPVVTWHDLLLRALSQCPHNIAMAMQPFLSAQACCLQVRKPRIEPKIYARLTRNMSSQYFQSSRLWPKGMFHTGIWTKELRITTKSLHNDSQ
jgi:hypothetical protein